MNGNMLTQIDDDMLDQVSGGTNITIGGAPLISFIDDVVGAITEFGDDIKAVAAWIPTISIDF